MACKSGKYHIPEIPCPTTDSSGQQRFLSVFSIGNPRQSFFQLCYGACNIKLFFCAGKGNIENSQFFAQTFSFQFSADNLFVKSRRDQPFFRKYGISSKSQLRMDQKPGVYILEIKLFSHSRSKHHRKFQSLAFMNRHDLYCSAAGVCHIHFAKIHLIFLKALNISDKIKQSPVAGFFIIHCFFHQHTKVGSSLISAGKSSYIRFVACRFQNIQNQLVNRSIGCHMANFLKLTVKFFQPVSEHPFFLFFSVFSFPFFPGFFFNKSAETFIQKPFRTFQTDQRQILSCTAHQRRMQHTCKRNILQRVVTDSQIVQKSYYLLCRKIPRSGCGIRGNPI